MKQQKFLTAVWKNLVMANYEIEPAILQEFVPANTELDYFNSKCYVSLVGFMFLDTKILGVHIPFHVNFEEVNLRFYVKHKAGDEWKRGVTFIKEIVPKFFIELVANNVYSENYDSMPMRNELNISGDEIKVGYYWKPEDDEYFIKASAEKNSFLAKENSEEEFITEHYWGYTKVSDTKTSEYEVEHPKWNLHNITNYEINCDFGKLYGDRFSFLNDSKPSSIFLAEGSEVIVRKGKNI
jgi:uncharacterized protein YqjF (DUF2071 family)